MTSAREVGMLQLGRLARARLIQSPPAQVGGSRFTGPQGSSPPSPSVSRTFPFSRIGFSPPLLFLPWRRRLGERRRHLSLLRPALCRRRASIRYARPFSFLLPCEAEHPQTLTKLFVFGSESSYNILPTNSDFVCKNYRVYMCTPMPYAGSAPPSLGFDMG